jgi:hypothetical protein
LALLAREQRPDRGRHNLIKRVKRAAFGFTSSRNYRIRALLYTGRPNWLLLATITPRWGEIRRPHILGRRIKTIRSGGRMAKAEASVGELVGMIERGELCVPEMQRHYVWRVSAGIPVL